MGEFEASVEVLLVVSRLYSGCYGVVLTSVSIFSFGTNSANGGWEVIIAFDSSYTIPIAVKILCLFRRVIGNLAPLG